MVLCLAAPEVRGVDVMEHHLSVFDMVYVP